MLEERDQTIGDLQFSLDERTMQLEEVWPDNMTSSAVCSEAAISIVVKKKKDAGKILLDAGLNFLNFASRKKFQAEWWFEDQSVVVVLLHSCDHIK